MSDHAAAPLPAGGPGAPSAADDLEGGRPRRWEHWWAGERVLCATVEALGDDDHARASLLPGWTRHTLLAHLATNADALVNLLTWARTGVETPMYASPAARQAGIAAAAHLAPGPLRAEVLASSQRLTAAVHGLPAACWSTTVRTAQGRTVTAAEVPWMRARESWVHAVDLDVGRRFSDLPEPVLRALVDDVTAFWRRREQDPGLTLAAEGHRWGFGAQLVTGPLAAVTRWVTGRSDGDGLISASALPVLPAWL